MVWMNVPAWGAEDLGVCIKTGRTQRDNWTGFQGG